MSFQRARSNNQIKERVQEIIDATSTIYNSVGYEGLNFSVISDYTKLTRPSIYKYFKTKDEILLKILLQDTAAWTLSLINSFKINKLYSINEIVEIWTDTLINHARLLELYSLLFTSIEKNVSIEALAEFKKESLAIQYQLVNLVNQLFPKASNKAIMNFILSQITIAFGLYPMSKLSNIQIEAIKLSGSNYTAPDFRKTYMSNLYQFMYCLEHSIEIKETK